MTISEPTLDALQVDTDKKVAKWSVGWATWFSQAWYALQGWTKTYYATLTFDFGNIAAQSQATTTLTIAGARSGDIVVVMATTAVNGIILDGSVTASNTVTIRAVNYSAAGIDPASQVYRVLVFQQ